MQILGIVDIHSKTDQIEDLLAEAEDADLVLVAGDITNFGVDDRAEAVLKPLIEVSKRIFAVTGNCDYGEVDGYLERLDLHLEGKPRSVGGIRIIGVGGSLPCPSSTPHEHSEEELKILLEEQMEEGGAGEPLIAVIHQPPFGTKIDKSLLAGHVGSEAVRTFIEEYQPLLCFSGHIHESPGIDTLGESVLVNPGPFLKGRYFLADINDGKVQIELKSLMS
ncbi:MAG: metallophosphoesterase family protein [Bdellovibrionales bacterium]|nr:metallophosphoesterase family protein [Bdellovibrionales bacterium]